MLHTRRLLTALALALSLFTFAPLSHAGNYDSGYHYDNDYSTPWHGRDAGAEAFRQQMQREHAANQAAQDADRNAQRSYEDRRNQQFDPSVGRSDIPQSSWMQRGADGKNEFCVRRGGYQSCS